MVHYGVPAALITNWFWGGGLFFFGGSLPGGGRKILSAALGWGFGGMFFFMLWVMFLGWGLEEAVCSPGEGFWIFVGEQASQVGVKNLCLRTFLAPRLRRHPEY